MSTHKICFHAEIRKIWRPLLAGPEKSPKQAAYLLYLQLPRVTVEENAVFVEVYTGEPDLRHSKKIARLTGVIDQPSFISLHNFMTILLIAGDSTSNGPALTFTWTLGEYFICTSYGNLEAVPRTTTSDSSSFCLQLFDDDDDVNRILIRHRDLFH